MGYPYPLPKKYLSGFVRIPGVILEASGGGGGFKPPPPPPPVASPLVFYSEL
jgi:hypothetical protein